jgi:hypothetical protein
VLAAHDAFDITMQLLPAFCYHNFVTDLPENAINTIAGDRLLNLEHSSNNDTVTLTESVAISAAFTSPSFIFAGLLQDSRFRLTCPLPMSTDVRRL